MAVGHLPAWFLRARDRVAMVVVATIPFAAAACAVSAQTLPFDRMPGRVVEALYQFRQTDHPLALALNENLDGDRIGLVTAEGFPPLNFDPSRNLQWVITDLNADGGPEVLMLLAGTNFCGNFECPLLIFTERSRRWHLVCESSGWAYAAIRLLPRRSARWREFLAYGRVAWRRKPGTPAGIECVERDPLHHHEGRRQYDRHGFPIPWPEVQRRRGRNPDGTPLGTTYDDPLHREWEQAVRAARRLPR